MWLPIVLGAYWVIVLVILGRMMVMCSRAKSDTVKTDSTDDKE